MKIVEWVKDVIQDLSSQGHSTVKISRILFDVFGFRISRQSVRLHILREGNPKERKKIPPLKFTDMHKQVLNMWMKENKDLSARDIQRKFMKEFNVFFSLSLIKNHRRALNWTMKRKAYCQLITHKNKLHRVEWCLEKLSTADTFSDVIFVDESNVELSSAGRISFYQIGSAMQKVPSRAPKPKHSYQDNDSKHKSKSTRQWMEENGILEHVMVTPASSPDINPIENVWSAMKDFLQRRIKPKTKEQLVEGIRTYWETVTPEKCGKFIDHIHKVLPVVVLNNGSSTEY